MRGAMSDTAVGRACQARREGELAGQDARDVLLEKDGDADQRERDEHDAHHVRDHLVGLLMLLLELIHVRINAHLNCACAPSEGGPSRLLAARTRPIPR